MRERRWRSKVAVREPVPPRQAAFLTDVAAQIAAEDEATRIPSDDLLQVPYAYGGRLEAPDVGFGFTYFPTSELRPTWELLLSEAEIAQVAEGSMQSLRLWRCEPDCGRRFAQPDESCFDCDYVSR